MAELAARNGARIIFASLPTRLPFVYGPRVLRTAVEADVVLVDSIAAAFLAPWIISPAPPAAGRHRPSAARRNRSPAAAPVGAGLARPVSLQPLRNGDRRQRDAIRLARSGHCRTSWPGPRGGNRGSQTCDRRGARAAALCVANWLPNKGILELLDAAAALPAGTLRLHFAGDERTHTRLRAAGDPPDRRAARPGRAAWAL